MPLAGVGIAAEDNTPAFVRCDHKLSRACRNLDDEKGQKGYEAYPAHVT